MIQKKNKGVKSLLRVLTAEEYQQRVKRTVSHPESELQIRCVKWFRMQYPQYGRLLFSVPNGVKLKLTQARIAKAEGMVAGVADLLLLVSDNIHHGLCIELKNGQKGRQSDNQREWQEAVEREGYKYVICRTEIDFRTEIYRYLKK